LSLIRSRNVKKTKLV